MILYAIKNIYGEYSNGSSNPKFTKNKEVAKYFTFEQLKIHLNSFNNWKKAKLRDIYAVSECVVCCFHAKELSEFNVGEVKTIKEGYCEQVSILS